MSSFHAAHFSSTSVEHFALHFLGPAEDEETNYEEGNEEVQDDGLGYYEDGVKRTLTDEQIAMFRHSEIQTLLRERRRTREAKEEDEPESPPQQPVAESKKPIIGPVMESVDFEEGELEDDSTGTPTPLSQDTKSNSKRNKKKNKSQKANQRDPKPKGFFKQNIKPDLRKRTWDKVETGLDALDYDEMDGGSNARPNMNPQRRRISYED